MRERFHADQEVADNHRRAKVCAIVEGFLSDALQVLIARVSRFSSSLGEGTHGQSETVNLLSAQLNNNVEVVTYSRKVSGFEKSSLLEA